MPESLPNNHDWIITLQPFQPYPRTWAATTCSCPQEHGAYPTEVPPAPRRHHRQTPQSHKQSNRQKYPHKRPKHHSRNKIAYSGHKRVLSQSLGNSLSNHVGSGLEGLSLLHSSIGKSNGDRIMRLFYNKWKRTNTICRTNLPAILAWYSARYWSKSSERSFRKGASFMIVTSPPMHPVVAMFCLVPSIRRFVSWL